jgi:hypothetical protein
MDALTHVWLVTLQCPVMQKLDLAKSGPRVHFWLQNMDQGVHFLLPKVDPLCQMWTWSTFVDLVHF